jgi:hypothetical protein
MQTNDTSRASYALLENRKANFQNKQVWEPPEIEVVKLSQVHNLCIVPKYDSNFEFKSELRVKNKCELLSCGHKSNRLS